MYCVLPSHAVQLLLRQSTVLLCCVSLVCVAGVPFHALQP